MSKVKPTALAAPAGTPPGGSLRRLRANRPLRLTAFLLLQALAAVFFLGDGLYELAEAPLSAHSASELIIVVALCTGVIFGILELRDTQDELRAKDRALDTARGHLALVIGRQFGEWSLTAAERDVGFLALKGFDVAEIASLRGAAAGTVRAQLTRIYAKAGVSGRAQFAALFVEDLLGESLDPDTSG